MDQARSSKHRSSFSLYQRKILKRIPEVKSWAVKFMLVGYFVLFCFVWLIIFSDICFKTNSVKGCFWKMFMDRICFDWRIFLRMKTYFLKCVHRIRHLQLKQASPFRRWHSYFSRLLFLAWEGSFFHRNMAQFGIHCSRFSYTWLHTME